MINNLRPATSTQPQVDPTFRFYSPKKLPTIRVRLKDSSDDREMTIYEKDFDPDRFVRLN